MTLPELVGRRVRIWLGVASRGEVRSGRNTKRFFEGVVETHPVYGFVVPALDKRLPFVIDETRILDVYNTPPPGVMVRAVEYGGWIPVFHGKQPVKVEVPLINKRCSYCNEIGHVRQTCPDRPRHVR